MKVDLSCAGPLLSAWVSGAWRHHVFNRFESSGSASKALSAKPRLAFFIF